MRTVSLFCGAGSSVSYKLDRDCNYFGATISSDSYLDAAGNDVEPTGKSNLLSLDGSRFTTAITGFTFSSPAFLPIAILAFPHVVREGESVTFSAKRDSIITLLFDDIQL